METIEVKFASLDKYILGKTLGSGANSKVKLGWDPSSDQYFAIKIIKHSHPHLNLKVLKREIEILTALNHPNIIKIYACFGSADYVKKNGETYKVIAIVMELVPGGELYEYIAEFGRFSEEAARTYFRMLLETIEYCHNKGIVHRDLKPENLLFDDNFNLKIADFGFATLLEGEDGTGKLQTFMGTESYMAPELHLKKEYSGVSVDLFASGVILFILMSGFPPFSKADPKNTWYKLICEGKYDTFWNSHQKVARQNIYSDSFKDLMNAMLAFDPEKRPTIEQIKGHMWYQGDTINIELIKDEFMQRKETIEKKLQKLRDAKRDQKLLARMQIHEAPGAYTGFRPYRSFEAGEDGPLTKEFLTKFNFDVKRELQKYQPQSGFKFATEIFTVMNPDFAFKLLCNIAEDLKIDVELSSDTYKIKGKVIKAEGGRCCLNIVLTKVDDTTTCIEFHRKNGNVTLFYKTIEEIKKKMPQIECQEDEAQKDEKEKEKEKTEESA